MNKPQPRSLELTRNNNAPGFTIVELLIVIVVIAILAAISIVAYNGIQQRANNTAIRSAAAQTVKAIQAYVAATGEYPSTGSLSCLVPVEGVGCRAGATTLSVNASVVSTIRDVATLPANIPAARPDYLGVMYDYTALRTFNGDPRPVILIFSLPGSQQDCGPNSADSGAITIESAPRASSVSGMTLCVVSVPGPGHAS